MSNRTAFTVLEAAILGGLAVACPSSQAVASAAQDPPASTLPDQPYYPPGYLALREAADALEREEHPPAAHPVLRAPPRMVRRARETAVAARPPAAGPVLQAELLPIARPPEPVVLNVCGSEPHLTVNNPRDAALEYAARRTAYIDNRLRANGYPPYLFDDLVRDYERAMLGLAAETTSRADDPLSRLQQGRAALDANLVRNIEARRVRQREILPSLMTSIGCTRSGHGHAPYYVRAAPTGGRVWVIPIFRFMVCERTAGVGDPWSVERCRQWLEVHPDEASNLVGRHKYQARWRNGAVGRGDRTFEQLGLQPVTVTVQPD